MTTDTRISAYFITLDQGIAMLVLSVFLVALAVCLCFPAISSKEPLGEVGRKSPLHTARKRALKIITCLVGVLIAGHSMVSTQNDVRNGNFFIVLFLVGAVVLFVVSELLVDLVISFCERKGVGICKIVGRMLQTARNRIVHLAAILALILVAISAVTNFSYSCQAWAEVLSDKQLNLDAQIVATNDIMGNAFIGGVSKGNAVESVGTYYTAHGKFGLVSAYVITEADGFTASLNKFYDCKAQLASLSIHEVVVSSRLLAASGMKVGDEATVSLVANRNRCVWLMQSLRWTAMQQVW